MKIIAYTDQEYGPFVPVGLQADDMTVHGKLESSRAWYEVATPFELSDAQWIGVMPDRTIVRIPKSKVREWTARTAQEVLKEIGKYPVNDQMGILRACAALVGTELPSVLEKVRALKKEGETYEEAVRRIRSNGTKT